MFKKGKRIIPLSDDAVALVAQRFRVLGEPMRLKILIRLHTGEKNVTELVDEIGAGQANISKHLGILADAHIISRRRDGGNVYYCISDPQIFELCDLMCSKLQKEFRKKSAHFH